MSLAEAANIYKTRTDIADKVREGEALTPEEYAEVNSAYAEQEKAKAKEEGRELSDAEAYKLAEARARSEFEANRWGEYELSDNVNPETWATNLESVAMTGFDTILKSIETATTAKEGEIRDFSDATYTDQESAIAGLIAGNTERFTPYGIEISDAERDALLRLSTATTDQDRASAMQDLTALGWDPDKWLDVLSAFDQIIQGVKEETTEAKDDAETGTIDDNRESRIKEYGFEDLEEFKAYAEELNNTLNETDRFESGSEELYEFAEAVAEAADGFEELQDVSADTWKMLKDDSKKGTKEWTKQI
jgi:hypothetical protein